MPSPNEITCSQLNRLVGTESAPAIIDLRIDEDYQLDPRLLPTAFRHPFNRILDLLPQLVDTPVVVYCQQGKKISHGAMALLRSHAVSVETLVGGFVAWHDAKLPLIEVESCPNNPLNSRVQGSVWVTRHRPKVDRIACPWLIKRFVDRQARFLFVPAASVLGVAERYAAIPFDIPDVFWSHRGDHCTFDTMLEEFSLQTEPLLRLARIIRGADTDKLDLAPQAAGLLAASLGLSRIYKDDLQQLEAGLHLYDAFYRWCRDATGENHEWITSEGGASSGNE